VPASRIAPEPPAAGPIAPAAEPGFLHRAEVRDVLAWVRLLVDPHDAAAVVRALARPPIELRQAHLARVIALARRRKLDLVAGLGAATESPQVPPEARERIERFVTLHRNAAAGLDGLAPDAFTGARNARAKAVAAAKTTEGARELAARIRRLPKPSVPAWSLNMLARAEPGMLEDLVALRNRFAEAQRAGDRAGLRALDSTRHEAISAALQKAAAIAADAGTRLGPQATQDMEQTLRAAVADANAAAAVRSGLLVRPLTASGFEPVDIADAVAVPLPDVPAPAADESVADESAAQGVPADGTRERRRTEATASRTSKAAEERARRAAKEAVSAAEERVRASHDLLESADIRVRDASAQATRLGEEESRLRKRLTEVAEETAALDRERRAARHERDKAEREAERAALALERARRRQESTRAGE